MPVFSAVILLLAGAVNLYFEIKKRRRCSVPAVAVVVEIKRDRGRGGGDVCMPVLAYTASGKSVRGTVGVVRAKQIDRYKTGKTVEILYNPEKPEDFRIAGKNGVLILSVLLLALGIGGLAALIAF